MTPEYHGSVSGVLKNVNLMDFETNLTAKVTGLISVLAVSLTATPLMTYG